jgi:hypothetical protein
MSAFTYIRYQREIKLQKIIQLSFSLGLVPISR